MTLTKVQAGIILNISHEKKEILNIVKNEKIFNTFCIKINKEKPAYKEAVFVTVNLFPLSFA